MKNNLQAGSTHPLGATLVRGGANFSLFSRSATRVELLFFDHTDDARPGRTFDLDPDAHRTYHYWHAFVPGVKVGQFYVYCVHGLSDPARGMRFDPTKVLLDPYGRGVVVPPRYSRESAARPGDNAATAMKSVVADPAAYDWEGVAGLTPPYQRHTTSFPGTRRPRWRNGPIEPRLARSSCFTPRQVDFR